jgi:hypothetical protein
MEEKREEREIGSWEEKRGKEREREREENCLRSG